MGLLSPSVCCILWSNSLLVQWWDWSDTASEYESSLYCSLMHCLRSAARQTLVSVISIIFIPEQLPRETNSGVTCCVCVCSRLTGRAIGPDPATCTISPGCTWHACQWVVKVISWGAGLSSEVHFEDNQLIDPCVGADFPIPAIQKASRVLGIKPKIFPNMMD